jgi:O-methyltransferase
MKKQSIRHGVASANIQGKTGEPWVKLEDGKALAGWGRDEEIAYNQANRQTRKLEFYQQVFDFLTDNRVFGDYHEYGCHRVRTFRMALTEARRHNLNEMKFYAFDSFEGLPEVENEVSVPFWQKGALATSEQEFLRLVKEHGIYVENVRTVKGYYSDSLTKKLQKQLVAAGAKVSLVCVDCDLYESAVPVFRFIEPLLQEGTVIYLDDYYAGHKGSPLKGVPRAFHEHERVSAFEFESYMHIGWWGRSFIAYRGR